MDTSYIKSKFGAYRFESGRKGMSKSLLKKGLQLKVMDRNGKTYQPDDWPASLTFHIKQQEGLLVSDNRTREYEESSVEEKKTFTYLAWGHKDEV